MVSLIGHPFMKKKFTRAWKIVNKNFQKTCDFSEGGVPGRNSLPGMFADSQKGLSRMVQTKR
jgi:hypothetical protein